MTDLSQEVHDSGVDLSGVIPLLQVKDMFETMQYYGEALGFSVDFIWPSDGEPKWAMVSRAETRFMFTVDLGTALSRFIAEKGNGVVFYVISDNVEALFSEVSDHGAIVVQELVRYGDRRQFTVSDPNGYAIAFSEPFSP